MRWSNRVGTLLGIPVRVHWTMLLLLLFVSWGHGWGGLMAASVSLLLLFGSVVAHELSHAMAARWFGIGTSEILLLPIGGVARIEREPQTGGQEVAIALAGPLMSLALAGLAGVALLVVPSVGVLGAVASMLLWSNLMLGLFNLLPAFPLDGGRILRGALRGRQGLVGATRTAARAGRIVAVPMAVAGLAWGSPSLVLIALFVWFAGRGELRMLEARAEALAMRGPELGAWAGWRPPGSAAAQREYGRGAADWTGRGTPRRFVVQAGPFGYVIRER